MPIIRKYLNLATQAGVAQTVYSAAVMGAVVVDTPPNADSTIETTVSTDIPLPSSKDPVSQRESSYERVQPRSAVWVLNMVRRGGEMLSRDVRKP
jgi:negative regulator of sigma E activity